MECVLWDTDQSNPINTPDVKPNNNPNHESVTDFLVKRSGHARGCAGRTPPHLEGNWQFALRDVDIDWDSAT
jgi:hypothetical protein